MRHAPVILIVLWSDVLFAPWWGRLCAWQEALMQADLFLTNAPATSLTGSTMFEAGE